MAKIRVSKGQYFIASQTVAVVACNVIERLGGTVIDVPESDDDSAVIELHGLEGSLDLHPQLQVRGLESTFVGNG